MRILPEHVSEDAALQKLLYIKPVEASPEYQMGNSAIAINGVWRELGRMADMARGNVEQSFLAVLDGDSRRLAEVERTEEYIDYLNKEISKYISAHHRLRGKRAGLDDDQRLFQDQRQPRADR